MEMDAQFVRPELQSHLREPTSASVPFEKAEGMEHKVTVLAAGVDRDLEKRRLAQRATVPFPA